MSRPPLDTRPRAINNSGRSLDPPGARPRAANDSRPRRRAFTLTELLVVVTVMILLLAVSVPLMKTGLEDAGIREAARQLNAYLMIAKSRALAQQRPAGIWIQRMETFPSASTEVYLAEVPPAYSGDAQGARVRFAYDPQFQLPNNTSPPVLNSDPNSQSNRGAWIADHRQQNNPNQFVNCQTMAATTKLALVKPGETFTMRMNFKGAEFIVMRDPRIAINSPPVFILTVRNFNRSVSPPTIFLDTNITPPPAAQVPGGTGATFQAFFAPERAMGRPLQLPSGIVIDLVNSGIGIDGWGGLPNGFAPANANDTSPVIIMFNPAGGVERVVRRGATGLPLETIHLMIGQLEGLEDAENSPDAPNLIRYSATNATTITYNKNLASLSTRWISIGNRTGAVTTSENAWELVPPKPWPGGNPAKPFFRDSLRVGREFAQSAQTMGGR